MTTPEPLSEEELRELEAATPEPWTAHVVPDGDMYEVHGPYGITVADCDAFPYGDPPESQRAANTKLIALAPFLLNFYLRHREAAKAEVAAAQTRVAAWVRSTFGERSMADKWERIARFVEEAIELGQAEGLPEADAARILARVYNHPIGIGSQEVGGVMVTLLAWAASSNTDLMACALTEIERIEKPDTIARIREKQEQKAAAGTAHSFAPAPAPASAEGAQAQERESANNSFKEEANGADGLRLGDSATQERREGAARGLEREGDVSLPDSTRAPDGRGCAATVAAVHRHEDGGQQAGAVAGISDGRVGRGLENGVVAPGGASHAPAPSVPAATPAPRTYADGFADAREMAMTACKKIIKASHGYDGDREADGASKCVEAIRALKPGGES